VNDGAVRLDDVSVTIGGTPILEHVTARVPANSCTMIVGPNGAGKTTLLQAILGQISYTGTITIGTNEDGRLLRMGYVPQNLNFDRGLPLSVVEFLAAPYQKRPLWFGVTRAMRERAQAVLEQVEAIHLLDKPLGGLSGGELQRVLVAAALMQDPELLVLDEPTAGMDVRGEQIFCELIEQLRARHGFTQLMVSHDIATVTYHATHVLCLNRRLIVEGPPFLVLTEENLRSCFGVHLGLPRPDIIPPREGSGADFRRQGHA